MSRTGPSPVPSFAGLRPASEAASRAKRANRKTNSKPEVLLRKAVWRLGLRYRKNVAGVPGHPDVVFTAARVVVFCDGDFWHGRDWDQLKAQLERRHNAAYWVAKIARNRERDREHTERLTAAGWLVIRIWESEIGRDPAAAATRVQQAVEGRLADQGATGEARPGRGCPAASPRQTAGRVSRPRRT